MPRKLFTIITGDTHQCVLASTFTQAVTWAEANLPAIKGSTLLTISITPDLVDLTTEKPAPVPDAERSTGAPASPPPPARMTQPKAAKRAKPEEAGGVPAGMVLVKDLATELGLTPVGMRYRLDRLGVPIVRLDLHGRPGAVMADAARAAMAGEHEERTEAPKRAKARPKPAAPPSTRKGEVDKPAGGRMLLVEKAAIELGLTDAQVREIQRNGSIKGGNGWVDVDGLRAYMESDEYEPPFTSN